jgi:deazaflavin-dependent oxidoreductase (nitroreductase family)
MLLLWRLGLGSWGNPTEFGGAVMVIKHTGRKSGLPRLTPVNYAILDGEIYCTAGFGSRADWFRNIQVHPQVEVWLPDGRRLGVAQDVTVSAERLPVFRAVLVASGFAAPLFGVNPRVLSDA